MARLPTPGEADEGSLPTDEPGGNAVRRGGAGSILGR
ncbi:hypothetical protein FB384_002826 [Prauserella sediminis]|uniref:Uncharacterized protein n=1 Tax=Prauserella sediminis TaxID=577680 RepID=A0A839XJ02_9PSEU|nr:hypothetical protein [Prauserella sediminis]